jgi:hypothetical protein
MPRFYATLEQFDRGRWRRLDLGLGREQLEPRDISKSLRINATLSGDNTNIGVVATQLGRKFEL